MALRFAGLGSVVERSATKAAIAQASLSAARRDARSDVAHIAPEVAAAYTLRMTRTTRVVFRCDQNIMRARAPALPRGAVRGCSYRGGSDFRHRRQILGQDTYLMGDCERSERLEPAAGGNFLRMMFSKRKFTRENEIPCEYR